MSTQATAVTAPPKVSVLKHIGNILGNILKIFTKDVAPAEPIVAKALEAFLPQFAPEIATGDALFTKIARQILVTETSAATVATPPTGETKLQAVTDGISAELNTWVKNLFPGAKDVSAAQRSGLVQAIFNIVDEQPPAAIASVASNT